MRVMTNNKIIPVAPPQQIQKYFLFTPPKSFKKISPTIYYPRPEIKPKMSSVPLTL